MNLLLSYYIDKNTITDWKTKFSGAGQKVIMYKFKGTNGRYLNSFDIKFNEFKFVEGKKRADWPVYENGQLIHKQYTVPMIETRLFYKEDGIYHKTEKGKVYEKYLSLDMNLDEKWLINYLLLMDSTIASRENYIINRSIDINNIFEKYVTETFALKACEDLFKDRNTFSASRIKEIANYDYLYLNSFYLEPEFLKLYYEASEKDRKELHEYVYNNWDRRTPNCCITQKFISTNYSVPELIDDLKIYRYSLQLSKIKYSSFESTIADIVSIYKTDYDINEELVLKIINENKNIFEPILMNVYNVEETEDIEETEGEIEVSPIIVDIDALGDRPEPRIDDTTIEGKQILKSIFAMKKKIAREKSGYKCELELYKGCRYFTSKTTHHNYVEVHHFVPREFRNLFENSVDVLSNYITLCPHCHRMIHLATDRERIDIIRYIYSQRIERLKKCGLEIEFNDLLAFYNVEGES